MFNSEAEEVLPNLKETSARYCFVYLFLVKMLSQDGEHFFDYLKIKMLCSVMLYIEHSGPES